MKKEEIEKTVRQILQTYITSVWGNDFFDHGQSCKLDVDEQLNMLIFNSVHAVNFLVLLEAEFEIELPDDVIGIEFFTSIPYIVDAIQMAIDTEY